MGNSVSTEKELMREKLTRSSREHIGNIEKELQEASDRLKKGGKSLLIVAGGLLSAYLLFELITKGNNKPNNIKKKKKPRRYKGLDGVKGLFFGLTEDLVNSMLITLLGLLKEKLAAYIDQLNEPKEHADLPESRKPGEN